MFVNLNELDIFYLSYDEPKKEEFWADISNKVPWAKRVDGVKGFDNAHKECARQSETDRFITVDGDNIINEKLFDEVIEVKPEQKNAVFSWTGKNMLNGLAYGNGGIKCWSKDFVLNMKTHENSDDEKHKVDFCWYTDYIQMNNIYSYVYVNQSPYHSFRAGFREGVKMTLLEGEKPKKDVLLEKQIFWKNFNRLLIWCSVGADVEYGLWAIYGARLSLYKLMCTDWDHSHIRDYDWMQHYWYSEISKYITTNEELLSETIRIGDKLKQELHLTLTLYDEEGSKFFKKVYTNPPRVSASITEREIDQLIKK